MLVVKNNRAVTAPRTVLWRRKTGVYASCWSSGTSVPDVIILQNGTTAIFNAKGTILGKACCFNGDVRAVERTDDETPQTTTGLRALFHNRTEFLTGGRDLFFQYIVSGGVA